MENEQKQEQKQGPIERTSGAYGSARNILKAGGFGKKIALQAGRSVVGAVAGATSEFWIPATIIAVIAFVVIFTFVIVISGPSAPSSTSPSEEMPASPSSSLNLSPTNTPQATPLLTPTP